MVVATPQNTNSLTTDFEIKVDGQKMAAPMRAAVEEIAIDEALHLPAMLTIRLHVDDMEWLGLSSPLVEGKRIEVEAVETTTRVPLFKGMISGIEPDMSIEMPLLTVRAYDLSYKLHRQVHRRSFLNVTDGDVIRKMAGEAGLSAEVDDPGTTHAYLFQPNVSNYDYIRERAWLTGFDFHIDGDKLYFKRPHSPQPGPKLTFGTSLHRFRPRSTTFEPVQKVDVRGWDPKAKREIVGTASTANGLPKIGQTKLAHAVANEAWGNAEVVITHLNVESQAAADQLARSYLDELGGSHIEAEGLCNGNAKVRLLREVEVEGVGARFSGKYTVTAVNHTYTNRGHQTGFTVSARRTVNVRDLLEGTRPKPDLYGPVIGIVTNLKDPEKKGRVKVKFPWLADQEESNWARIATPLTGAKRGMHFLPEINDEVLVAFEHGDINNPYIIGGLWNGKDEPPVPPSLPGGRDDQILKNGDSAVKNRLIKSTKGNMLIFNDSDDAPGVFLVGSSGAYVMVDDKSGDEKIAITDKTRQNRIEIWAKDKSIHIECQGDLIVDTKANLKATVTGNADLTVTGNLKAKATGTASVESTGPLTLKSSSNVSIEATGMMTIKGAIVSVEGQGAATLKAPTVQVNGTAATSIQGGAVAISGMPLKLN